MTNIKLIEAPFEKQRTIVSEFSIEINGIEYQGELHQTTNSDDYSPHNFIYRINKAPTGNNNDEIFDLLGLN